MKRQSCEGHRLFKIRTAFKRCQDANRFVDFLLKRDRVERFAALDQPRLDFIRNIRASQEPLVRA